VFKRFLSGGVVNLAVCITFAAMLAKLGPLVSEVAGSIGGATFQRSPHGTVVRSKPLGIVRRGTYSSSARQRLKSVNDTWKTLTPTQQGDWQTFADTQTWYNRFGDPIVGTGYMAFLKNNLANYSSVVGAYPLAIQPTYPTTTLAVLAADPEFVYELATNTLFFSSSDAATDANTLTVLFMSQPCSNGRSVWNRPIPYGARIGNGTAFNIDITTEYVSLHGRLPDKAVSERAFLRITTKDINTYYPGLETTVRLVYK